jgi:regulator of nucleoside diphosphate kinase
MMTMLLHRRTISKLDKERLIEALDLARGRWATYAPFLDHFRAEVWRAAPVEPRDVSGDTITMNSRFALLDLVTDERTSCTLVYPEDESPRDGRISILSPMGTVLLGARVGDDVCWDSADGPQVARITGILFQLEAAARARHEVFN